MGYLVAAYTVIWVVTFVFIFSIASRQRKLAAEIEDLQLELDRIAE